LSKHKSLSCSAHTIQLCIEDSLKACSNIQDILKKSERIVKFFKKSNISCKQFVEAQRKLGMKELKLFRNVKTRWNSEFYMLQRVHENKNPLKLVLSNFSQLPTISADDLLAVDELIDVLAQVEAATRILCGSKYSTISTVIPFVQNISNEITSMKFKSKVILKFRACLIRTIQERFDHIETNKVLNVATLLDPRFKKGMFYPIV
jgi:zinc finger BED domain-containing protein 1 (E3 SUMO-protein ligase ZBED1)